MFDVLKKILSAAGIVDGIATIAVGIYTKVRDAVKRKK